jgi:hypothetical protein
MPIVRRSSSHILVWLATPSHLGGWSVARAIWAVDCSRQHHLRYVEAAQAEGYLTVELGVEISSAKWVGPVTDGDNPAGLGAGGGQDGIADGSGSGGGNVGDGHWALQLDTGRAALECDVLLLASGADVDIDQCVPVCEGGNYATFPVQPEIALPLARQSSQCKSVI